ncbi:MAG: hypothetical protein HY060_07925 [Proteobacteria bacterium]|nr:hypothetical protein [Pseudomonadota bacterium]
MKLVVFGALGALGISLGACIGDVTANVPDDHPASPRAAAGSIDLPNALAKYKSADEFEAPGPEAAPPMHGSTMGAMSHDGVQGMQDGGAPAGAKAR